MSDDFLDGMNDFIDPDGCHDKATGKWQKERPGWAKGGVMARIRMGQTMVCEVRAGNGVIQTLGGSIWPNSCVHEWWSEPIEVPPMPTESP